MGKWGKRDRKKWESCLKLSPFPPMFLLFSINFTHFFVHLPRYSFGNFSQISISPHFPPFPPISPQFFHLPHFPKPLRLEFGCG